MMPLKTHKFARKPFYVDAVRVSEANIKEVAEWCGGEIKTTDEGTFISVEVYRPMNDRQKQAFVGDWVLYAGSGYKVYTPAAFDKSFEKVKTLTKEQADAAGIKVPHEPRPKGEKKRPVPKPPRKGPRSISTPVMTKEQADQFNGKSEYPTETGVPELDDATVVAAQERIAEAERREQADPDVDYRSAETGQYVSEEFAEANPDTTVAEEEQKQQEEADKLIEEVMKTPQPGDQS